MSLIVLLKADKIIRALSMTIQAKMGLAYCGPR